MYADQHLHTSFSGDSETPPEEQAEKAIALGMERICFTDHHDHDVVSDIDFELDIPRYMAAISELKKKYSGRLDIRSGIELGLQSHIADYLYKLTEEYPFDFVIGSVHFIEARQKFLQAVFRDTAQADKKGKVL